MDCCEQLSTRTFTVKRKLQQWRNAKLSLSIGLITKRFSVGFVETRASRLAGGCDAGGAAATAWWRQRPWFC